VVAGNIGTPLTSVTGRIKKGDLLILEVSSYQIPFSPSLAPEVAVLLNIFPEHLDWHGGYDNYVSDKMALFSRQSENQAALLNYGIKKEHPELFKTIKSRKFFFSTRRKVRGAYIKDGGLYFSSDSDEELLMPVKNYKLKGEHNLENLAAAAGAARLAGVNKFPDISGFRNLPHRMEEVLRRKGVLYINDSKATNMDSLYQAVKSLEAPLILLAGGRSKESLHPGLKDEVAGKAKEIILFGESRGQLKKYFSSLNVKSVPGLKEAVSRAKNIAQTGDTVLLSPGGSSFDEFNDYRHRGDKFKEWVKN
jgi:UDP-N-acetylmuramoylalanine--D-glutamate ligase